jgi:hypothetical protein
MNATEFVIPGRRVAANRDLEMSDLSIPGSRLRRVPE